MGVRPKIILLCICICNCIFLHAQNKNDSSYAKAVAIYTTTVGVNTHLYSGSEYMDYDHRVTGNPFFADAYFTTGSIVYNDILYNNVQLFYDEQHDEVVLKSYNDTPLVLVREKVTAFDILGHHFINLQAVNTTSAVKDSGFYDVLYNGNTKLFVKRKKLFIEKITTLYAESLFQEKEAYYFLKDNTLYAVNDKNSVLAVLKDKKNAVSKFLHQAKISFRQNPEAAMIKMTAYYDSLNNTK